MRLTIDTIRQLWPRAPDALREAVAARSATVFARYGLTTPLRVRHFLAQVSHESNGGTITRENLSYSTPERIAAVWPRRFASAADARPYVHNPEKLAAKVYDGREDLGNTEPGDGYRYRGRGLLQITGRASYRTIGAKCGLPLEQQPDLAFAVTAALEVAAAEFVQLGCLPFCDKDNVEAVTRRVNGGYTGLASRKTWLAKWRRVPLGEETAGWDQSPEEPEPPPVEIPRGSDETLPPGVDHPDKGIAESKTVWATMLATLAGIGSTFGQAVDELKPLLADPHTLALLAIVIAGAGAFIVFDRWRRLKQDRV